MYTVYVHKNLKNEKYYVGCTSREPKERWASGWGYKFNTQMWKDIQNSDWNTDWQHGILGKFENKDEALKYEAFLIAMLGSIENGYNTSSYSGGTYKRSEVTKRKMAESKSGENNPWYGKTFTEDHRKKISDSMTGKVFTEEHRKHMSESKPKNPVLQYSKTGDFISEYSSIWEASRQTTCNAPHICDCCKGKRKSTGGYIWKYKE